VRPFSFASFSFFALVSSREEGGGKKTRAGITPSHQCTPKQILPS
jgi:hypothetical protein